VEIGVRITAADLARRLEGLVPIGLGPTGTNRLAWTDEDAAAAAWFEAQADGLGRSVRRDPAGNLWAVPDAPPPWWGVGSHLDSVRDGGRYDGALGVAAAFEVAARTEAPLAVISFADEEGARFNTPTFGSRALVGRLNVDDVLERADDDGITLRAAMTDFGLDPGRLRDAPSWLDRLRGFLELHIDQTRDLATADSPAGVVRVLAARLRLAAELTGRADHAGTTRRAERRDALAAAAQLIVRAGELADGDLVTTASRILVEPNALTTVPGRVRLWLDARAPEHATVAAWRASIAATAAEVQDRTSVTIQLSTASESAGVAFDAHVREALAAATGGPELVCFAGHDAGVIAERRPAGMILVRNPTGVSHAPDEEVSLEDAAAGADALLRAAETLA
jgi:N-carbamoyl-L-amino-acid hydrolase